jgi:hypothetical protein
MFKNVNVLLRTLVLGALVVIVAWWTLFLRDKLADRDEELNAARQRVDTLSMTVEDRDREIRKLGDTIGEREEEIGVLEETVAEAERRIEALDIAMKLLKVDHRIAKMEVVSQGAPADDPERIRTVLHFTELGPDGEPMGPGRDITLEGKTVYVETLVVKFEDSYVEHGDSLRGTSLCLFKRVFGEDQKPADGAPLDTAGQQPLAYSGDETPSPLHREIWTRFWDYANDPELASQLGVRAIHGEAPFIETRPGKTYWVELRSSDGMTIRAE